MADVTETHEHVYAEKLARLREHQAAQAELAAADATFDRALDAFAKAQDRRNAALVAARNAHARLLVADALEWPK